MLFHSPRIVTDGLVLYLDAANPRSYPGSGTTWSDLSGNGNNGTLINSPSYSADNLGSFGFDGANNFVSVSNSNSLNPSTNTLICWVKSNTSTWNAYGTLMSKRNVFVIHPNQNITSVSYYYYLNNSWKSQTINASDITVWNMYACSWDGSKISGYLNGILKGTSTQTGPLNTSDAGVMEIGRDDQIASRVLNGNISHASLYNRALSPEEIEQNFNATRGRFGL